MVHQLQKHDNPMPAYPSKDLSTKVHCHRDHKERTHHIPELDRFARQFRKWQMDITLTGVRCIVNNNQCSLCHPHSSHANARKAFHVSFPSQAGCTVKQFPLAITKNRFLNYAEEFSVKFLYGRVKWFLRSTDQMRGDAFFSSFKLSLVEKS